MFNPDREPAAEAPAQALSPDELEGVAGGAPLIGDEVCVMKCKTCGARFYGPTRAVARKKLFKHVDFYKH